MIPILYEDGDVIAANKPEGLASIPERSRPENCLVSLLTVQLGQRLYIVHRLDKDASGLILFARNARAHSFLNDQFAAHTAEKVYLALVQGVVVPDSGRIDAALRQFGSGRMGVDADRGKPCTTGFSVRRRFTEHTLLEIRPQTGRRHQIRVHLYSRGHPIAGDLRYGERSTQRQFPRLMLHAFRLGLKLPAGAGIVIEAPVPESFLAPLQALENPRP
jgi:tRNA pseudouridine32 synthase/23S rRNA pseudouridine746 synthase